MLGFVTMSATSRAFVCAHLRLPEIEGLQDRERYEIAEGRALRDTARESRSSQQNQVTVVLATGPRATDHLEAQMLGSIAISVESQ